jgi:hypothetical protein
MQHQPIAEPDELRELTSEELFERLRPLLRQGGLLTNYERLQRITPNLPSVCFELAAEWQQSPRLDGKDVPFREYLAARLRTRLLALDQEQHPNLYDSHGRYQPDGQTLPLEPEPLDDVAEVGIPVPAVNASYSIFAETAPWPQQLQTTGIQEHIAQPSLAAVIELVSGIAQGEKGSPYRTSRQLGSSSLEARNQPATAIHLAILDYVADRTATASRPPG